jgi:glycosyltransferase involved in cell wall biosynthesis
MSTENLVSARAATASDWGSATWSSARIEVVLCTFNGRAFVVEQLDSIARQTRPVQRIIICDDCSTDGTATLIEDWCSRHPEVRLDLHRNTHNLGYAANFSSGIRRARGDVVFLCDQDDVWEPIKVETLLECLARPGALLAFSDGTAVDAQGVAFAAPTVLENLGLGRATQRNMNRDWWFELLRRNVVNGAACAVRTETAQAAMPPPAGWPHDYWLALWCAAHAGVVGTNALLYRYRQHSGNAIGMGMQRTLHQWAAIWRSPRRPRLRDLELWRSANARLVSRTGDSTAYTADVARKLQFLEAVVGSPSRYARAARVVSRLCLGQYRRYAPDWALRRDVIGLFRG